MKVKGTRTNSVFYAFSTINFSPSNTNKTKKITYSKQLTDQAVTLQRIGSLIFSTLDTPPASYYELDSKVVCQVKWEGGRCEEET